MKIAKKQMAIGTAVFAIGAAGLLTIGTYSGILRDSDGMTATDNSLTNVVPESLEPAQPDIANMIDMINMGE